MACARGFRASSPCMYGLVLSAIAQARILRTRAGCAFGGCPTRGWGWCSAGAVHQHGGASRVRGLRVLGSVRDAGPEAA